MSDVAKGVAAMRGVTWDGLPITPEPPYGASVVVWRRSERGLEWLILHRHHHGPDYEGDWAWGPPSGARMPGEPVEECASRELREEVGLDLACVQTSCGSADWVVFAAEAPTDASIVLSPEHDAFLWVPLEEAVPRCLPALVGESFRAVATTLSS